MYPASCVDLQPAGEVAGGCYKDGQAPTRPRMIQGSGTAVRRTNVGAERVRSIGASLGNRVNSHMGHKRAADTMYVMQLGVSIGSVGSAVLGAANDDTAPTSGVVQMVHYNRSKLLEGTD